VASRKHTPIKIFFGDPNELMLHGKVAYVLKAGGKEVEIDWAGRVEFAFDESGGNPKVKFYQVYLVCTVKMSSSSSSKDSWLTLYQGYRRAIREVMKFMQMPWMCTPVIIPFLSLLHLFVHHVKFVVPYIGIWPCIPVDSWLSGQRASKWIISS